MSRKLISTEKNFKTRKIILPRAKIPCSWPECPKRFVSLKNLEKHLKFHTESMHKCNYCNRQFQTPSNLNRHIRIHTGEKPFACSLCPKSFSTHGTLQSHTRTHTSEKLYNCKICGRSFAQPKTLVAHQRIHIGDKTYIGKTCGKSFNLESLDKHSKVHTKGLHKCGHCYRRFQTKSELNRHIRTHTGEKPYPCSFCRRSFSRPDGLQVHMRIHTGEKPYNCKICAKSFSQPSNLVEHQRVHNGDKPYKCTFCPKTYAQLGSLKIHMRIHTGERPYNCTICSKSFAHPSSLRRHMRKHTDKTSRAHAIGGKCNISDTKQGIRKVENSGKQNQPNNCKQQAQPLHEDDLGYNQKVSMHRATTTKIKQAEKQTKSNKQNKQHSFLTCQVCHQVLPSLGNLCRHYSLQHNLPKVLMQNLVI